jgi:hypothetical protein
MGRSIAWNGKGSCTAPKLQNPRTSLSGRAPRRARGAAFSRSSWRNGGRAVEILDSSALVPLLVAKDTNDLDDRLVTAFRREGFKVIDRSALGFG